MLKSIKNLGITLLGILSMPTFVWVMVSNVGKPWPLELLASIIVMILAALIMVLLESSPPAIHELVFGLNILFFMAGGALMSGMSGSLFFMIASILSVVLAGWIAYGLDAHSWLRKLHAQN